MSKVIFIRGLPGIGKSELAKELYKSNPYRFSIIEPEQINLISSTPRAISVKKFKYRINLAECIACLQLGKDVLWAQPWRSAEGLNVTIENIKHYLGKNIKFVVLELIDAPTNTWNRSKSRLQIDGYTQDQYKKDFVEGIEKLNLTNAEYLRIDINDLEGIKRDLAV